MAAQIERDVKLLQDPAVNEYVNRVGQNIARNSDAKVPFTIKVIDSGEVNAFALPGGFLFVNTGLVLAADDEAELAGVMAHEIGHVAARHGTENASKAQILDWASIPLIFLGGGVGFGLRQAAGILIPMQFLKFSRKAETEADYLGVRMLKTLGYTSIEKFHMNEGHASLLLIELLKNESQAPEWDFEAVRNRCIFTTHTPVAAGHDQFNYGLVGGVIGEPIPLEALQMLAGRLALNMTLLGLNLSRYVNGVARRHGEVSREMYPGYPIHHITNGVHAWTWTSHAFKVLYDDAFPGWAEDRALLRKAVNIPASAIWTAHTGAKRELLDFINERSHVSFSADALTIGFARRATQYKRADLVFSDLNRLLQIADRQGPIQFVFAGKAHPHDQPGKELIRRITALSYQLRELLKVVYLEDYDFDKARLITSGVDLWLNTPQRPLEASGTSGMKAALNGVPSLSTLDGWWLEGHIEGITGWSVGSRQSGAPDDAAGDAADLYRKLEETILPMFQGNRDRWLEVMRHTIALNGSYFTTHRMVQQYITNAYL